MLNHAIVCFFAYAHTYRHRAVGAVLMSMIFCARFRGLMDVKSTMLDRIPLELPQHGVASFSEDTFV